MKASLYDHARHYLTGLALVGAIAFSALEAKAQQALYVGNNNASGAVLQYSLPLNASSTPNFTLPTETGVISVGVDASGNLAVGNLAGATQFFTTPISAASVPSATFSNPAPAIGSYQIAFTNAGDMWVAGTTRVNLFTHPFSNASTPSTFVTMGGLFGALGTALDNAQNLYVTNATASSNLLVYAPPYTGAPIATPIVPGASYRKLATTATQLFVAVAGPGTGRVDVYNLPITAASAPAFSISAGTNLPEAVAFDAVGNLYVGNLGNSTVSVYNPPFTSGSAPSVTVTVSGFSIFGIAIGNAVLPLVPTPAPSTLLLLLTGLSMAAVWMWRNRRRGTIV